jgi:hypothetical protein
MFLRVFAGLMCGGDIEATASTAEQPLTPGCMITAVPWKEATEPFHNLPFLRNRDFVGRMKVVENPDAEFSPPDSSSRNALVGLGGMG